MIIAAASRLLPVFVSRPHAQHAAAHALTRGFTLKSQLSPAAGLNRHILTLPSSPADASSVASLGCHRTQFTSSGCAPSRLHSNRQLSSGPCPSFEASSSTENTLMLLSALAVAMNPAGDQSMENIVRSWTPATVVARAHRTSPPSRAQVQILREQSSLQEAK